jgi:hypothetical protein
MVLALLYKFITIILYFDFFFFFLLVCCIVYLCIDKNEKFELKKIIEYNILTNIANISICFTLDDIFYFK